MTQATMDYLAARGIPFTVKPHAVPVFTCEDAARERGVRLSQIVKCMVGKDTQGGLHVMLIPGDKTLKLKRVRGLAGSIRIDLVDPKALAEELGLIVGAISPTQFEGRAKIYMDNSLFEETLVDISSGSPDAGVELACEDLARILSAIRGDIISTSARESTD